MSSSRRPLSPHLFIYKFEITMIMSIVQRITGMALYGGVALLVLWLGAAAMGPKAYAPVAWLAGTIIGQLVLFGLTWALFNHMIGGIRHFIWDLGGGFSREARFGMAWITAIGGLVLSLAVWIFFVWL